MLKQDLRSTVGKEAAAAGFYLDHCPELGGAYAQLAGRPANPGRRQGNSLSQKFRHSCLLPSFKCERIEDACKEQSLSSLHLCFYQANAAAGVIRFTHEKKLY